MKKMLFFLNYIIVLHKFKIKFKILHSIIKMDLLHL